MSPLEVDAAVNAAAEAFFETLTRLHEARGWNQRQLAEASGLHQQTISRYREGLRLPDFRALVALATALEVTVDELLGRSPAPPRPRPLEEWDEDDGAVLWWALPVREPPYVGSPLDDDFPGHFVTHWTPLVCPEVSGG